MRRAVFYLLEPLEQRALLAVGVLDQIIFGNTTSETGHTFVSTSTQVISGNLGQSARQELPLSPVQVNGGSMSFNMTVDPVKRNYFTIKLWGGDDTSQSIGRLYLYIPINGINGWSNGKLSEAITAFTATDVELLARSYTVAGLSTASPSIVGYHNASVVSKVIAVIDGFATDYYSSPFVSPTSIGTAVTGGD